jgi:transcriptional regulator
MYTPKHFEETRLDVLHALMRAHPLATLVTLSSDGLTANHIPLHIQMDAASALGTLVGHVARNNPVWQDLQNPAAEVLVIFQGPNAYITPSWYPSKQEHGKVVPTWNYAVVHAHGVMRVVHDAAWLKALLETLTAEHEAAQPKPWSMQDAPRDYLDKMMQAIVGIEIPITRLNGKWKVSQNQSAANQAGVVAGLQASIPGGAAAQAMAALVAGQR